MIRIKSSGSFARTKKFLEKLSKSELQHIEDESIMQYADEILRALYEATPKDSGETANSWDCKISHEGNKVRFNIYNHNMTDGVPVAILLQYGHATNGGGYVRGIDYINPAVQPIFDRIESTFWKEVVK